MIFDQNTIGFVIAIAILGICCMYFVAKKYNKHKKSEIMKKIANSLGFSYQSLNLEYKPTISSLLPGKGALPYPLDNYGIKYGVISKNIHSPLKIYHIRENFNDAGVPNVFTVFETIHYFKKRTPTFMVTFKNPSKNSRDMLSDLKDWTDVTPSVLISETKDEFFHIPVEEKKKLISKFINEIVSKRVLELDKFAAIFVNNDKILLLREGETFNMDIFKSYITFIEQYLKKVPIDLSTVSVQYKLK